MRVREKAGREMEEMGKHRKREKQNKDITVSTDIYTERTHPKKTHTPLNTVHPLKKFYMDHWCLAISVFLVLSMWGTPKAFLQSAGCISW